ncbi:MAG: hypothetical protein WC028_31465 [Candidatus Obscuribacterales bacterium]
MNQPRLFPVSLGDIAILGRSTYAEYRSVWQDVSIIDQGHNISELAKQQRGVTVLDHSLVFPTFFTAGAVELLMTLPNHFWFWNVVYLAAMNSSDRVFIDGGAIRRVFAQTRDRVAAVYDLNKPIDQLSAHELAVRVAEGVILFKSANWQHLNDAELVFNVIFQPQAKSEKPACCGRCCC